MYKTREVYMCIVLHTAPSLKSAASEIVFRMLNKEKFLWILEVHADELKLTQTLTSILSSKAL